jgi:hypothetical protein
MAATINADELSPEQRRSLGIRKPREQKFSQEGVRRHAIRVLAAVASLTREQRDRVLRHALKLNKV